jgi:threonylcarbamoyladenosine tRNA methylthiotransferase MtaB
MEFVAKIGFSHIHVFKYSKRAGTKAAQMPNQIPEEIKTERSYGLIALSDRMADEYKNLFVGRIEKILFEEELHIDGVTYQVGHNERYLRLAVVSNEDLSNRILEAKICSRLTQEILLCEITH